VNPCDDSPYEETSYDQPAYGSLHGEDAFYGDPLPAQDWLPDAGQQEPGDLSPHFAGDGGGYSGDYNGVPGCWYSSDGYVYAPDGARIGAH
jgi:hypothetical protein